MDTDSRRHPTDHYGPTPDDLRRDPGDLHLILRFSRDLISEDLRRLSIHRRGGGGDPCSSVVSRPPALLTHPAQQRDVVAVARLVGDDVPADRTAEQVEVAHDVENL